MPDSREMAAAILLLGFVVSGLAVRGVREHIPDFIRSAAPLLWLLAVYLASAALVVWGAWSIRLWVADLWWSTSIVVLGLGASLVSSTVGSVRACALGPIEDDRRGRGVHWPLHQPRPVPRCVNSCSRKAALAAMLRVVAKHQGQTLFDVS